MNRNENDRVEKDWIGQRALPGGALYGIHTARAVENFPISRRPVHPALITAYGAVKLACALTNRELGVWKGDPQKTAAIVFACREMASGQHVEQIVVDELQGGAGTSTNMNVNEVLTNRALTILGLSPGRYDRISPLDDLNRHQSTNDTYPTALRLAAIRGLLVLKWQIKLLARSFRTAADRFRHVMKIGRTQLQDAVPIALGEEMRAYADALNRSRERIPPTLDRLKIVNLGGTAIGTGVAAPSDYAARVVRQLRQVTSIDFANARNLIEATQNADVYAEVSGVLKALAATLWKVCSDLRLLASGPSGGFGELRLPERQAGSSIMPGKVNPVIPEAVTQSAMRVFGHDQSVSLACASGCLELNPFLPLVAASLLESIDLLARSCDILRRHCVDGLEANEIRCRERLESSTAMATALVPSIGYARACDLLQTAKQSNRSIRDVASNDREESGAMTAAIARN
jgi:aspartate ammonia-lyase